MQADFSEGLFIAMPWWAPLTVRSEYSHLVQNRADWFTFFSVLFGLVMMYGAIKMFRSLAFLRHARYLGRGTEAVFLMDAKERW